MKKLLILILSVFTGGAFGAGVVGKVAYRVIKEKRELSDKHLKLFLMMNQWVKVKQADKNLVEYFLKRGYRKIAVYGMSYVGRTLIDELADTEIAILYGIDKNIDFCYTGIEILSIEDNLEDVDAIVVTAVTFFDEIEHQLSKKVDCPIISLEDVLYEV